MIIALTMHRDRYLKGCMDDLLDKYHNIVIGRNRLNNIIRIANGDVVRGFTSSSRMDGIRVDIAIGIDSDRISRHSKIEDPVWDFEKLYKYLDGISKQIPPIQ